MSIRDQRRRGEHRRSSLHHALGDLYSPRALMVPARLDSDRSSRVQTSVRRLCCSAPGSWRCSTARPARPIRARPLDGFRGRAPASQRCAEFARSRCAPRHGVGTAVAFLMAARACLLTEAGRVRSPDCPMTSGGSGLRVVRVGPFSRTQAPLIEPAASPKRASTNRSMPVRRARRAPKRRVTVVGFASRSAGALGVAQTDGGRQFAAPGARSGPPMGTSA